MIIYYIDEYYSGYNTQVAYMDCMHLTMMFVNEDNLYDTQIVNIGCVIWYDIVIVDDDYYVFFFKMHAYLRHVGSL